MTVYRAQSAEPPARPRNRRRLAVGLFGATVLAAAGAAVPALADSDPDVRLIVGLESAEKAQTVEELGDKGYKLKKKGKLDQLDARTLEVSEDDATKIAAKLRDQDGVEFVQVDRRVSALEDPDPPEPTIGEDPDNPNGPGTPGPDEPDPTDVPPPAKVADALEQLKVPQALETASSWSSQTIAVIDSGVNATGNLAGSVLDGTNVIEGAGNPADASDDNGHGTKVASLVKAACPSCKILPVKALDKRGTAYDSEVAQGITYAADKGAKVINLSFGAPVQPGTPDAGELLQAAIDYARGKGAVVLASAGNDARGDLKYYPAANTGVIAVGGTNEDGGRYTKADDPAGAAGSSYGASWVDVAAPYCAKSLGETFCGTSASSALASGVAGLIKSRTAAANQWTLENALTTTATPPASSDRWLAFGEIRADKAVVKVDTTAPVVGNTTPGYMQVVRGTISVAASNVTDAGGSGLSHAWLYADGKWAGSDNSAPFAVNFNTGTRNGVVKLQWKVFDKAGNAGILNRNFVADNTAPALTWTAGPANNAKVKGTVTVSAKSTDTNGVWRVELWMNGKLTQWDWSSGYSFKVNTGSYGKSMTVQLRARDQAGNWRNLSTRTWKR